MPRIKPSHVALARWHNPLLGKLMGVARTQKAAEAELRWMEEVILRLDELETARLARRYRVPFQPMSKKTSRAQRIKWGRKLIQKFVEERSHGMPFAHVVGSPLYIMEIVIGREPTVWAFDDACASRCVYSTMGNGRVGNCFGESTTEIAPFATGVYAGRFMFRVGMYTHHAEKLCVLQY